MNKLLILVFGVFSYFVGVAGLLAIIAALAGFVPWGFFQQAELGAASPFLWNILLVTLWGIIHSVMARPWFKQALYHLLPAAAERSLYVLVAGVTSLVMVGLWQVVPGQTWDFSATQWAVALWAVFVFGWAFCFASTFAINHFDLFGLQQVYLNFKDQPEPPISFVSRFMYSYVRHPIQTGVLIGVWATPTMSMTQLGLSLGFSLYILIGLWFEEKDLINSLGQDYVDYKNRTPKLFPRVLTKTRS